MTSCFFFRERAKSCLKMPPKRRAPKKAAAKVAAPEPEKEEVVAEQPTEETSQVAEVPAEVVAENGTNDSVENWSLPKNNIPWFL